jgi:hypothetical protein
MFRELAILSLIITTGCASMGITMKSPGRHEIGNSYSISTSRSWSHISGPPETWTIDGPALGVLRTWAALEDGDTLVEQSDQSLPQFRSNSNPVEVAELVADTLETLVSGADVETTDFKPMAFGEDDGFRFNIRYVQNGLPYKGIAAGAIRGDKLDLLLFSAPAEYYFDLYAPEIEHIISSVKTSA